MLIEVPGSFLEITCQATAIVARGAVDMLVNDAVVLTSLVFSGESSTMRYIPRASMLAPHFDGCSLGVTPAICEPNQEGDTLLAPCRQRAQRHNNHRPSHRKGQSLLQICQ